MEGIPPTPRKPRSEARPHKKAKTEKSVKAEAKRAKAEKSTMKSESMDQQQPTNTEDEATHGFNAKEEPFIKPDPFSEPVPFIKPEPVIKPEPLVKEEPMDDSLYTVEETDPPISGLSSAVLGSRSPSITQQPITEPSTPPKALPKLTHVPGCPPALKTEPHSCVKMEPTDIV